MLKCTFFSLIVIGTCLGTLCARGAKDGEALCIQEFTPTSLAVKEDAAPIDRHALVTRHNIECNSLATTLPLGNGEFCFTADATGLQTFAGNALAHWGWHTFPGKDDLRPLNLGRLRLCHGDGSAVTKKEITAVKRTLDLWSGIQTSQFEIAGQPVRVETCADPKNDAVAVRIESPLLVRGELLVTLDFPYAWTKEEPWLGDWSQPELHTTKLTLHGQRVADFDRKVDEASYHVRLAWSAGAQLAAPAGAPHAFRLSSVGTNRLDFVCAFAAAPVTAEFPDVGKVFDESSRAWKTFWSTGGAIDLSGSKDPRCANWNGAWCSRNISPRRSRRAVGRLPKPVCSVPLCGAGGSTWRWSGGIWRISRSGTAGNAPPARSAATSASCPAPARWRRKAATRGLNGRNASARKDAALRGAAIACCSGRNRTRSSSRSWTIAATRRARRWTNGAT